MSGLNGRSARAEAALESYLSLESPAMRSKVYEIISLTGLEPDDPMFLVLALTGQIRVFLEAAPEDLGRLLAEWKRESARSLSEVMSAISSVRNAQVEQAEVIKENMEAQCQQCVSDIKEAGMATVGAIASANNETLDRVQDTSRENREVLDEVKMLRAQVKEARNKNQSDMNDLIGWVNKATKGFQQTQQQVRSSQNEMSKLQQKTLWLKVSNWYLPLLALTMVAGASFLSGGWLMSHQYNDSNSVFGRKIVSWNIDRIINCQKTSNPKCTVWIVPPDSPLREGVE